MRSGRRGSTNGTTNSTCSGIHTQRRVDLAPERARVAARHRPRDLRPGPRLDHRAGRVVDVGPGRLLASPCRREVGAPASAAGLLEDVVASPAVARGASRDRGRRAVRDRLRPARPVEPVAGGRLVQASGPASVVGVGPARPSATRAPRPRRRPRCGRRAPWRLSVTHAQDAPIAARPSGAEVRADHRRDVGDRPRAVVVRAASTPQKASAPSESTRCSEPWLPPPTWSTPPQSGNS